MEHRPPSHEELVDLSWLLDSAVVVGDRERAIEAATRLLESLVRHQETTNGSAPGVGATTAVSRDAGLTLLADVASLVCRLHDGDVVCRVEFRHRVQALAAGPELTTARAATGACRCR